MHQQQESWKKKRRRKRVKRDEKEEIAEVRDVNIQSDDAAQGEDAGYITTEIHTQREQNRNRTDSRTLHTQTQARLLCRSNYSPPCLPVCCFPPSCLSFHPPSSEMRDEMRRKCVNAMEPASNRRGELNKGRRRNVTCDAT